MFISNMSLSAAIICGLSNCVFAQPTWNHEPNTTSNLTQQYYPDTAHCVEYSIPVSLSSVNQIFNFTQWTDDYGLEDFVALASTRAGADYPSVIAGNETVNATYEIAASFCTPKTPGGSGKEKHVILATHGIGLGREHWNSAYQPEDYNFVQHAIAEGYSVFFYDRLGCGNSTKLSGFKSQISQPIAVLRELAALVRSGMYTSTIGKPTKLALMGVSFGSYITHFTIAETPDIADAVVLTGIEFNTSVGVNGNGLLRSFVPRIAQLQNAARFGELDDGYLTWVDQYAFVLNYFKSPFYDAAAAMYNEAYKQAFSIGEFLTFPVGSFDASGFKGAALAITGLTDYIVCDGYCPGIFEEPGRTYYRNAKVFVPHLHPNASHNINFHHNATGAYQTILGFLDSNL